MHSKREIISVPKHKHVHKFIYIPQRIISIIALFCIVKNWQNTHPKRIGWHFHLGAHPLSHNGKWSLSTMRVHHEGRKQWRCQTVGSGIPLTRYYYYFSYYGCYSAEELMVCNCCSEKRRGSGWFCKVINIQLLYDSSTQRMSNLFTGSTRNYFYFSCAGTMQLCLITRKEAGMPRNQRAGKKSWAYFIWL